MGGGSWVLAYTIQAEIDLQVYRSTMEIDMKSVDKQFIEYRAQQLAIILLTDRGDLHLKQMDSDYGLDLMVSILKRGREAGRLFGVEIGGVMSRKELHSPGGA